MDCRTRKVCAEVGFASSPTRKDNHFPEWTYDSVCHDRFILAERRGEKEGDARGYAVWDRVSGRLLRRFSLKPEGVVAELWRGQLSPNLRWMAVTCTTLYGNEVSFHDTTTGRRVGKIVAPCDVVSFDFSPDGKTAVTSCVDTSVLIWDLGRTLGDLPKEP